MITFDPKDPSDVEYYEIGWTTLLDGDTISAISSVTLSPTTTPALTENAGSRSFTSTSTTVLISGGKAGVEYTVAVKITTAGGRTLERSARLPVREQ